MSALGEVVDVIDEKDNVLEKRSLGECLARGLLHRAILVILLDSTMTRTYIQKRSERKAFFAGMWSASCTGHVASGEDYHEAAVREIREELGLAGINLEPLFKFTTPNWKFENRTEYESITAFEGIMTNQKITLLKSEVDEGKYIALDELKELLETEEGKFTPDSVTAFNRYNRMPRN